MSSFGMLLSDLLGVLFGAEPGETLTLAARTVMRARHDPRAARRVAVGRLLQFVFLRL